MQYNNPNSDGAIVNFKNRYENYIAGKWLAPLDGKYFDNISPVNGEKFCEVPRSTAADVELALDAAHAAKESWAKTSITERSNIMLKMAARLEANLEMLAVAETWDNGKAIRETLNADIPLCIDHLRYYAGCIRGQEGGISEIDENTIAYHFHEPYGVVGQIIPWNFPLLMAVWNFAPAIVSGNCVVLKPAEQTPASILLFMELVGDLLPPGVLNIVNGYGEEAGNALATSKRIAKVAFTGSTPVGEHILKSAAANLIPAGVELGGKSPNIYFADIFDQEDEFISKCVEGTVLAFFNQGEVCTCPSRLLVEESIYERFMGMVLERASQIKRGNPLDTEVMVGAQVSQEQFDRILNYIKIGVNEGAEVIAGGKVASIEGYNEGFYIEPTLLRGDNTMRIFQEEIFGPVVAVTTFTSEEEALKIANDTEYGLGAGVWTRDMNRSYRMGRNIQAGRIWTNCYHLYPAHAAFGGYKKSGIGRYTHKMALENYQQTKNLLVSYDINPLGFF